jgi:hypothetical protein
MYARHYKPRLVYFITTFLRQFLCDQGRFYEKFCPYVGVCNQERVIMTRVQ